MIESIENLPDLPNSWSWICLDDVLLGIEAGKSFKAEGRPPSNDEVGVLKVSAVTWKVFNDVESKTCIVPEQIEPRFFVQPGDFLFSRANTIDLVGACVIVGKVSRRVMLSDKTLRFRFSDISPDWVLYMLRTRHGRNEIERLATGNQDSMRNIGQARIRRIRIPFPPLEEQHRIVNKIEELFTQLDAGVDLLKKLKLKLKRYRQAVLKAAVEGKLTQDWRAAHQDELEPASVLLDRILKERREKWEADQLAKMEAKGKVPKDDKWKLKYKEPTAPDTEELPELPESWKWVSLIQISHRITDGTHQPPKFTEQGIPFIFVRHIVQGSISFENTKFISKETYQTLNSRCSVEEGDILYSAVGSYGVAVPVKNDLSFAFQRHIAHIKPLQLNYQDYLVSCLNSQICLIQAHKVARGVAQKTVTLGDLSRFFLPLPPISEQKIIAEKLDEYFSIAVQIEKIVDVNLKRAEKLRQSILKKAFEGRLVPQDPNDEPALLLLERIQVEKAQQDAKSKKRKTTTKKKKPRKLTKTKQPKTTDDPNEEQAS